MNVGSISLELLLDRAKFDQTVKQAERDAKRFQNTKVKISPQMDLGEVKDLGVETMSQVMSLNRWLSANPITPRVDISGLNQIHSLMNSEVGSRKSEVQVKIQNPDSRIPTSACCDEISRAIYDSSDKVQNLLKEIADNTKKDGLLKTALNSTFGASIKGGFMGLGMQFAGEVTKQARSGDRGRQASQATGQLAARVGNIGLNAGAGYAELVFGASKRNGKGNQIMFNDILNAVETIVDPVLFDKKATEIRKKFFEIFTKYESGSLNPVQLAAEVAGSVYSVAPRQINNALYRTAQVGSLPLKVNKEFQNAKAARMVEAFVSDLEKARNVLAKNPESKDIENADNIIITIGGHERKKGSASQQTSEMLRPFVDDKTAFLEVKNSYTDRYKDDPQSQTFEILKSILEPLGVAMTGEIKSNLSNLEIEMQSALKGTNPDAIRAAIIKESVKALFPDKNISFVGFSGGGFPVEQAVSISEATGDKETTGFSVGTPFFGLTNTAGENFTSGIGYADPLTALFDKEFIGYPKEVIEQLKKMMEAKGFPAEVVDMAFVQPSDNVEFVDGRIKHDFQSYLANDESYDLMQSKIPGMLPRQQKIDTTNIDPDLQNKYQDLVEELAQAEDFLLGVGDIRKVVAKIGRSLRFLDPKDMPKGLESVSDILDKPQDERTDKENKIIEKYIGDVTEQFLKNLNGFEEQLGGLIRARARLLANKVAQKQGIKIVTPEKILFLKQDLAKETDPAKIANLQQQIQGGEASLGQLQAIQNAMMELADSWFANSKFKENLEAKKKAANEVLDRAVLEKISSYGLDTSNLEPAQKAALGSYLSKRESDDIALLKGIDIYRNGGTSDIEAYKAFFDYDDPKGKIDFEMQGFRDYVTKPNAKALEGTEFEDLVKGYDRFLENLQAALARFVATGEKIPEEFLNAAEKILKSGDKLESFEFPDLISQKKLRSPSRYFKGLAEGAKKLTGDKQELTEYELSQLEKLNQKIQEQNSKSLNESIPQVNPEDVVKLGTGWNGTALLEKSTGRVIKFAAGDADPLTNAANIIEKELPIAKPVMKAVRGFIPQSRIEETLPKEAANVDKAAELNLGATPPHSQIEGFVIMQLESGRALADAAQSLKGKDPQAIIDFLQGVVDAGQLISQFHAQGYKHGDLHLNNVIQKEDGTVAPIDFGTMEQLSEESKKKGKAIADDVNKAIRNSLWLLRDLGININPSLLRKAYASGVNGNGKTGEDLYREYEGRLLNDPPSPPKKPTTEKPVTVEEFEHINPFDMSIANNNLPDLDNPLVPLHQTTNDKLDTIISLMGGDNGGEPRPSVNIPDSPPPEKLEVGIRKSEVNSEFGSRKLEVGIRKSEVNSDFTEAIVNSMGRGFFKGLDDLYKLAARLEDMFLSLDPTGAAKLSKRALQYTAVPALGVATASQIPGLGELLGSIHALIDLGMTDAAAGVTHDFMAAISAHMPDLFHSIMNQLGDMPLGVGQLSELLRQTPEQLLKTIATTAASDGGQVIADVGMGTALMKVIEEGYTSLQDRVAPELLEEKISSANAMAEARIKQTLPGTPLNVNSPEIDAELLAAKFNLLAETATDASATLGTIYQSGTKLEDIFTVEGLRKLAPMLGIPVTELTSDSKPIKSSNKNAIANSIESLASPEDIARVLNYFPSTDRLFRKDYQGMGIDWKPMPDDLFQNFLDANKKAIASIDLQDPAQSLERIKLQQKDSRNLLLGFELDRSQSQSRGQSLGKLNEAENALKAYMKFGDINDLIIHVNANIKDGAIKAERHWGHTTKDIIQNFNKLAKEANDKGYDIQRFISEGSPGTTQRIRKHWLNTTDAIAKNIAYISQQAAKEGSEINRAFALDDTLSKQFKEAEYQIANFKNIVAAIDSDKIDLKVNDTSVQEATAALKQIQSFLSAVNQGNAISFNSQLTDRSLDSISGKFDLNTIGELRAKEAAVKRKLNYQHPDSIGLDSLNLSDTEIQASFEELDPTLSIDTAEIGKAELPTAQEPGSTGGKTEQVLSYIDNTAIEGSLPDYPALNKVLEKLGSWFSEKDFVGKMPNINLQEISNNLSNSLPNPIQFLKNSLNFSRNNPNEIATQTSDIQLLQPEIIPPDPQQTQQEVSQVVKGVENTSNTGKAELPTAQEPGSTGGKTEQVLSYIDNTAIEGSLPDYPALNKVLEKLGSWFSEKDFVGKMPNINLQEISNNLSNSLPNPIQFLKNSLNFSRNNPNEIATQTSDIQLLQPEIIPPDPQQTEQEVAQVVEEIESIAASALNNIPTPDPWDISVPLINFQYPDFDALEQEMAQASERANQIISNFENQPESGQPPSSPPPNPPGLSASEPQEPDDTNDSQLPSSENLNASSANQIRSLIDLGTLWQILTESANNYARSLQDMEGDPLGGLNEAYEEYSRTIENLPDSRDILGGISEFIDEMSAASPVFGNIVGFVKDLGISALGILGFTELSDVITDGAMQLIEYGREFQRFDRAMTVAGKNGKEVYQGLYETAQEYGTSLTESIAGYTRLTLGSQGTGRQSTVDAIVPGFQKAFASRQSTPEQQARGFNAIEQMLSKGAFASAEELRQQLSEALPGAFAIAAQSMGMNMEEFTLRLYQGQIAVDELLRKMSAFYESDSIILLELSSDSFEAGLNRLINGFDHLKTQAGTVLVSALKPPLDIAVALLNLVADNAELVTYILGTLFLTILGKVLQSMLAVATVTKLNVVLLKLMGLESDRVGNAVFASSSRMTKGMMILNNALKLTAATAKALISSLIIPAAVIAGWNLISTQFDGGGQEARANTRVTKKLKQESEKRDEDLEKRKQEAVYLDGLDQQLNSRFINGSGQQSGAYENTFLFIPNWAKMSENSQQMRRLNSFDKNQSNRSEVIEGVTNRLEDLAPNMIAKRMREIEGEIAMVDVKRSLAGENQDYSGLLSLDKQRSALVQEQSKLTETVTGDATLVAQSLKSLETDRKFLTEDLDRKNISPKRYKDELEVIDSQIRDLKALEATVQAVLKAIGIDIELAFKNIAEDVSNAMWAIDGASKATAIANLQSYFNGDISSQDLTNLNSRNALEDNRSQLKKMNEGVDLRKQSLEEVNEGVRNAGFARLGIKTSQPLEDNINEVLNLSPEAIENAAKEMEEDQPAVAAFLRTLAELDKAADDAVTKQLDVNQSQKDYADTLKDNAASLRDLGISLRDLARSQEDMAIDRQRFAQDFPIQVQKTHSDINRAARDIVESYQDFLLELEGQIIDAKINLAETQKRITDNALDISTLETFGSTQGFGRDINDLFVNYLKAVQPADTLTLEQDKSRLDLEKEATQLARQVRDLQEQEEDMQLDRLEQLRQLQREQEDFNRQQRRTWEDTIEQAYSIAVQANQLGIDLNQVTGGVTTQGNGLITSLNHLSQSIIKKSEEIRNTANAEAAGQYYGTYRERAAKILRQEEGFSTTAYWDTNAWRLGYGTEFKGNQSNSYNKDSTITREEAENQLIKYDLPRFEERILYQVGKRYWNALNDNVKAALLSVAYNRGSLTKALTTAAQSGDINQIARTIQQTDATTHGERRQREAKLALAKDTKIESLPTPSIPQPQQISNLLTPPPPLPELQITSSESRVAPDLLPPTPEFKEKVEVEKSLSELYSIKQKEAELRNQEQAQQEALAWLQLVSGLGSKQKEMGDYFRNLQREAQTRGIELEEMSANSKGYLTQDEQVRFAGQETENTYQTRLRQLEDEQRASGEVLDSYNKMLAIDSPIALLAAEGNQDAIAVIGMVEQYKAELLQLMETRGAHQSALIQEMIKAVDSSKLERAFQLDIERREQLLDRQEQLLSTRQTLTDGSFIHDQLSNEKSREIPEQRIQLEYEQDIKALEVLKGAQGEITDKYVEMREAVEALNQAKLDALYLQTNTLVNLFNESFQPALNGLLDDFIDDSVTASEAWENFAKSILLSLSEILMAYAKNEILRMIFESTGDNIGILKEDTGSKGIITDVIGIGANIANNSLNQSSNSSAQPSSDGFWNNAIALAANTIPLFFRDGGDTSDMVIPNARYGFDSDDVMMAKGLREAMQREAHPEAFPAVLHKGEVVLSDLNGDAQLIRQLKSSGEWNQMKNPSYQTPKIDNFRNGSNFSVASSQSGGTNIYFSSAVNVNATDVNSFRKTQDQISREQQRQMKKAKR